MAIYLNTTNDGSQDRWRNRATRVLVIAVALFFAQPLWAQASFPANPKAQKTQPKITQTPAPQMAEVKVPNLLWLPRQAALAVLRNLRLQPDVTDDNQPGSVVIEQETSADATVPVYTKVRYTVGHPVLKLQASTHATPVKRNVHFNVILTPPAPPLNAQGLPVPVVYEFVWRRGERASQETTDAFVKEAPQIPGRYAAMVSATVNDVFLESNSVEIKVELAPVHPTPPSPSPTSSPVQQPKLPNGFLLLMAVFLGTLAAAYGFHKLKTRRAAASPRVKVSTGNRQIKAKILEPQSLKSKSLTRVRWVRGPLFKTMSPQEKIVKQKGAAHG